MKTLRTAQDAIEQAILSPHQIWGRNNAQKPRPRCRMCPNEVKKHFRLLCSVSCSNRYKYQNPANHPNWRDGASTKSQQERNAWWVEHQAWRTEVLTRDGNKCVECGSPENLEADHIKPWISFPELRFEIDNGRTLCRECHHKTSTFGIKALKYVA